MKSILEVSPNYTTLYEMPDALYDVVDALWYGYYWVYRAKPTMERVLRVLPVEWREMVSSHETSNEKGIGGHAPTYYEMH